MLEAHAATPANRCSTQEVATERAPGDAGGGAETTGRQLHIGGDDSFFYRDRHHIDGELQWERLHNSTDQSRVAGGIAQNKGLSLCQAYKPSESDIGSISSRVRLTIFLTLLQDQ
ncbi:hypothetical protein ACP70R_007412 [Stipagrostis hirtigluma subsp. patula]